MALTDNLISYYKLDGNSNDAHGSNNATINGAIYTASGKINGAYDFDGSNDYINCGNDTSLRASSNFTISAWIKPRSWIGSAIVAKYDSINLTNQREYSFAEQSSGKLRFDSSSNGTSSGYKSTVTNDVVLSLNVWQHVAITNVSGTIKLYANGVSKTLSEYSNTSIYQGSAPLTIGAGHLGSSNMFDGEIDEVGIWSRALSSTEVGELYNSGNGLSYDSFAPAVTSNALFFANNF